jgi:hypothetical protein
MKDEFGENFLEGGFEGKTKKEFKGKRKMNFDLKELENFKSEGICEREFKNFSKCKDNIETRKLDKNFCEQVRNLLLQCVNRLGKDVYK